MYEFRWVDWNVDHIGEHEVSPKEAEYVVNHSRRPWPKIVENQKRIVWGPTEVGRILQVFTCSIRTARSLSFTRWSCRRARSGSTAGESNEPKKDLVLEAAAERTGEAGGRLDRPLDPADMKPLTPAQQREERHARRKAGRPRVGAGAEKLRVSMERTLLKKVDAYARKKGISRSALIAESLRRTIGAA